MSRFQSETRVAVIGAGMSGLTCARFLREQGATVIVFEKSRGAGGRMSTRRTAVGANFDHGAQYFTVRDEEFRREVAKLVEQGVVAEWTGRICELENGIAGAESSKTTRYVGVPGMSSVGRTLAHGLDVHFEQRIESVQRSGQLWTVSDTTGERLTEFDWLVVTAPAAQTATLLATAAPPLVEHISDVSMLACWAVMLAFERPLELPFDGAFVNGSPISWIARNSSKPGRPNEFDSWVIHGSPEWSEANLELTPDAAEKLLIEEFWQACGVSPREPALRQTHRWRYSLPAKPLEAGFLIDPELQVAVCGDWCNGSRVEGAFLSGLAAARAIAGASRQV